MTPLEIEAFFAVIKAGSISAAAQKLYITQPALSRRIKTLEEELGYRLFYRRKGQRNIELTPRGEAFIPIGRKWARVWQEARELAHMDDSRLLHIASIGSVSSYILPPVFTRFSQLAGASVRVCFHNYHSLEAYQYVADGLVDIALISDDMYYKGVETVPAFQEPMVLLASSTAAYPETVDPQALDPQREIRLPWNPEYDAWHDYWFRPGPEYRVSIDQMDLLEHILAWKDTWAIAPCSVAFKMPSREGISIHRLTAPPPDRIIYYIKSGDQKAEQRRLFLSALQEELDGIPHMTSYLTSEAT